MYKELKRGRRREREKERGTNSDKQNNKRQRDAAAAISLALDQRGVCATLRLGTLTALAEDARSAKIMIHMAQITHKAHTHRQTLVKKTSQFKDRLEKSWLTRFADPNRMRAAFHTTRHTTHNLPHKPNLQLAAKWRIDVAKNC